MSQKISVYPKYGLAFFSIYQSEDEWICVLVDGNVGLGAPHRYPTVEQALEHAGVKEIVPGQDRYWLEE